ncbi:HD domain-containing protein [Candidatus Woesearchaeota archaeon]|nr:HD domain-containing protein [Candidatus Woesearchaeota archaeon]
MAEITEKEAVQLLRKYSNTKSDFDIVLRHSKAVQKIALDIGRRVNRAGKKHVDLEFLRVAAILHDIGRFEYPPWRCAVRHGVHGEKILLAEGLSRKYQRVCSCHLGAGIKRSEVIAQKLDIPARDYMPRSVEEKIICYADRRLRLTRPIRIETELRRFKKYGPAAVARLQKLHDEIEGLMGHAK